MRCFNAGTIQAYIDGELDIAVKKNLENHIADCAGCRKTLENLKNTDDFVFEKTSLYRRFCEEKYTPAVKEFKAGEMEFKAGEPETGEFFTGRKQISIMKGMRDFMMKYKKIAVAACLCIAVILCVTVQPVRAFISEALSIFRVENVKGIKVSLADMEEIRRKLAEKEGNIDIESLGDIALEGFEQKTISVEEAKNYSSSNILLPPEASDANTRINVTEPGTISFTLKVGNINEALKSFGAEKLLPETLEGKTFTACFAQEINLYYNINGRSYSIMQTGVPELAVPGDVDVDRIYDCMVDLPIIPENLQKQLKSIKDWKNTVYFPVIESAAEEIVIRGADGFISARPEGRGYTAAWCDGKAIYCVNCFDSSVDRDDLIQFAESLE